MTGLDLTILFVAFGKATILLTIVLVAVLILRRLEPRWRVLILRATIFAIPIVLISSLLAPQLNFKVLAPLDSPSATPAAADSVSMNPIVNPTPVVIELNPTNSSQRSKGAFKVSWAALTLVIWGVVAVVLTFREFKRLRGVFRESNWHKPNDHVLAEWRKTCAEFGLQEPQLQIADNLTSPFLKPGIHSALVIPNSLAQPERADLLSHVFRHEAAHLVNHDALWIPAARIFSCLFWFHPFAWLLASLHLKACEEASDAEAARRGGAEPYRGALAQLALDLVPVRAPAAAFLRPPGVLNRVRAIAKHTDRRPPKRSLAAVVGLVIVSAGGVLGTIGLAHEEGGLENAIAEKLDAIVIPLVEFEETPLKEAIQFLSQKSVELATDEREPSERGFNFVLTEPAAGETPITLRLKNIPLSQALSYTAEVARLQVRFDENAVALIPSEGVAAKNAPPPSGASLPEKLIDIVIPELEFVDTELEDAVAYLQQKSVELDVNETDSNKKGVKIEFDSEIDLSKKISFRRTNISLNEALTFVAELSQCSFKITPTRILLWPKSGSEDFVVLENPSDYEAAAAPLRAADPVEFRFDRARLYDVLYLLAEESGISFFTLPNDAKERERIVTFTIHASPFRALETLTKANGVKLIYRDEIWYMRSGQELKTDAIKVHEILHNVLSDNDTEAQLKEAGIAFPIGASAVFNPFTNHLVARNTEANLDKIIHWLNEQTIEAYDKKRDR